MKIGNLYFVSSKILGIQNKLFSVWDGRGKGGWANKRIFRAIKDI